MHPCPECGFDPSAHSRSGYGTEIRGLAGTYRQLLGSRLVRDRPSPRVWSALEYGAHVRDVFVLFRERLLLMLSEDAPTFANWDQDATAVAQQYAQQDPAKVAYDLAAAAGKLADAFDKLATDSWARTGHRSDGATFTIESFGTYLLHDPIHHVWDIRQGYDSLS